MGRTSRGTFRHDHDAPEGKVSCFRWEKADGFGYFPVGKNHPYNLDYFRKYEGYAQTEMGAALTKARVDLVGRHIGGSELLDVGIGCGQFICARTEGSTFGYDVNETAIRWLLDRGLWRDPYFQDPENASCFDSLEHMSRPDRFVERVQKHLFLSIPIFEGPEHAIASKHFRPDEHFYYFTKDGLILWMKRLGFLIVEENDMEMRLGREGIGTFVFRRS